MSELVKKLKEAAQQLVKVCNASPTKTLYARAADLLEKQDDEIKTLKSLAVCSSGEGTSFYYKDDWEARGKKIEKQDRLLADSLSAMKGIMAALTAHPGGLPSSAFTGPYFKLQDAIKQMEETL